MQPITIEIKNAKGSPIMYFNMMIDASVIAYKAILADKDTVVVHFREPNDADLKLTRINLFDKLDKEGFILSRPGVLFEDLGAYATKRVLKPLTFIRSGSAWHPKDSDLAMINAVVRAFTREGSPKLLEALAQ